MSYFNLKTMREVLMWAAIAGLIVVGYLFATDKREQKSADKYVNYEQRIAKRKAIVAAGPVVKVLTTAEGEVLEIRTPSLSKGKFLEIRYCTVWRDHKTKTTAMACENEALTSDFEVGGGPVYGD